MPASTIARNRSKKHSKKPSKKTRKSFSYAVYIFYVLILLLIIGNIIGSILYIRLDESSHHLMLNYVNENINFFDIDHWSFNQLFYKQFMYQGSIWILGLSVIGVIVNLFLVFLKGVITGFNIFFIFQTFGFFQGLWTSILWLLQYSLILGVTVLSGYFSIRFVVMSVRILFLRKNTAMFKKHLLYYFYQLVILMLLTLVTAGVTYFVQPMVYRQFERVGHVQIENSSTSEFILTFSETNPESAR